MIGLPRTVRRAIKVSIGALAGGLACAVVAAGGVDGAAVLASHPSLAMSMLVVAIAALVVVAVIRRVQFSPPSARAQRVSFWLAAASDLADLELALTLVAGIHVVIAVTGGLGSPAYPLLYGLVAFAMTVLARPGAVATLVAAILLEAALLARTRIAEPTVLASGIHVAYLIGAAMAHVLLLRGLTARYRRRRAARLDEELLALRDAARDYRLIAAALGPASRAPRGRDEEERLLAIGGVGMIGDAASWVLATLKRSLGATTVALLWIDDDGERVKLKEVASDADDITENPRLASAGILGAVVRDRQPLLCAATKPGQLPYYESGRAGVALVAVPLIEHGHLRGILAADRELPFSEADRDLLADASAQVLRVVQSEQVFRAVERAKYEHERFYQATAMLGRALTVEQVIETAFDAAAAIVEYDVASIALYDKAKARHKIAAVRIRPGGEGIIDPTQLTDLEFKDNAGLASMVVKNRHYLPAGGEPREVTAPIYTRKVKIEDARSLLVLPLLAADEPVGTLTLVARAEKRFGKDVREMLAVIANQVAISLENGFLYRKMETMATTDGLTGLTNHRTFQQRFADMLERAARHGHKV
ncbi:MAG TPA: GAF domain-containing protein, partial [Kofleriaceae bacterium]|nr:GAF domain-containing protein [Kofleriaceae bacterium]